jgi:formylglycine-generating enzyme required for sulfatase activity
MAHLAAGTFTRGVHHDVVTVHPFCLDQTEVTVDAYTACVQAGKCTADLTSGDGCNYGVSGRGNHPMNCVDWTQSAAYCHAQGKRLPSEDEWEWAARGGSEGRAYPWGASEPDAQLCWSGVAKREGTCAVGSYPAGDAPGGIHDLAGNVCEWTSTSHEGNTRVDRGGGWSNNDASGVSTAFRDWFAGSSRFSFLGLRCAR